MRRESLGVLTSTRGRGTRSIFTLRGKAAGKLERRPMIIPFRYCDDVARWKFLRRRNSVSRIESPRTGAAIWKHVSSGIFIDRWPLLVSVISIPNKRKKKKTKKVKFVVYTDFLGMFSNLYLPSYEIKKKIEFPLSCLKSKRACTSLYATFRIKYLDFDIRLS